MVFNATFNNISVISWWSALLVEEIRRPKKTTDLSQVCTCYESVKIPKDSKNFELKYHIVAKKKIPKG
jgi:hypothetical protein